MDRFELQSQAEYYRDLYRLGQIDRDKAKEMIMPYIYFCNKKSKELCKKYNQKHKEIIFANYVR